MLKHFLRLEWKSFTRSASFGANLIIKIFMGLAALYFITMFTIIGAGLYFILEESGMPPLETVNKYLIYYLVIDLVIRYFMQKMPVMNIKPLLVLPINRNTIVHFAMGKTIISFFNIIHAFLFVPFTVVLIVKGFPIATTLLWHLSVFLLIYSNSFINLIINNKNTVFYPVVALVAVFGLSQYYQWFDVTAYTSVFFSALSSTYYAFLAPVALAAVTYYVAFGYFRNHLRLDTGLAEKKDVAQTENFGWLDQFGKMGTFLKNDIRLLKRNKRSRMTIVTSVIFIFYGLLFFTSALEIDAYQNPVMQVFAGIFVSGGFLFTFGQFVPSWDSAYYQLMMSQNIQYKDYLASKWWLMVIATIVSTVIASFYLLWGWKTYMLIVVGAIYNIGVNSHLVLLAGAYVKTPIDLTSSKKAFGDKQAFNFKTLLLSLPKLLVPMLLYGVGYYAHSAELGFALVAIAGVIGFAFRNKVFTMVEKVYKTEKYKTIEAYKEKN